MGALAMSMRPLSLSTAADSVNCGPRGGDKAWTKKFTCLGVYVFFPGLIVVQIVTVFVVLHSA